MFTGNTSDSNGGALALSGQCSATIERTSFNSNVSASANGGAVYAQGVITVQAGSFWRNRSARDGGGIFMDQHNNAAAPGRITVTGSMFTENTAGSAPNEGHGGALYLRPDVADISRCTFSGNQSSANGADSRGGAICLDTNETAVFTPSTIKNCMFAGNQVSGGTSNYGGAVYITGQDITLASDTFTANNSAVDRGGAVYLGAGTMTIAACILVGNASDQGRDIYAEGTITSRGYNRIGVYGKGGNDTSWLADITAGTADRESTSWGTATFFGEDAALVANDGYNQAPVIGSPLEETAVYLLVIPLNEEDTLSEKDRASNAIPFARRFTLNIDELDIWGISRFTGSNPITIGCHYLGGGTGPGTDTETGLYDIAGITMSGIPGTLRSIGQTASLVALIHYRNGRTAWGVPASRTDPAKNQEERVTWESSMPGYVKVDENGNITALLTTSNANGATIRVKTVRYTSAGSQASDARAVRVTGQYSGMNTVSPAFQNYFNGYINDLMEHDISVSIADPDKSTIQSTGFKRNFGAAWNGASPSAITSLTTSTPRFGTAGSYRGTSGFSASKGAAVSITFQNRSEGDLFPLTYSWNLPGKAVKALLGADMTSTAINDAFAEKLFSSARIEYQTAGAIIPVLGRNGVSGSDARRYGALKVTKADGNAGLHIELTAYLANVSGSASQLVKGSGTKRLLVVPDGSSDGAITGTMWLIQPSNTILPEENGGSSPEPEPSEPSGGNTTSSGGGGGGGCSALPLGIVCAGIVLMFRRRH